MLQFRAVHKTRAGLLLRDIDLALEPGTALMLSGATGSGKSTLTQLVYGALRPDAGLVEVFGRDIARLRRSSMALLRQYMGIVPQTLELLESRTVSDNVSLPLSIRALDRRQMRARVEGALASLGIEGLARRVVASLSLGERQLVAIARALVASPALVIADEPTVYLDDPGRERVIAAIAQACEHGAAALIASNDHKVLSDGAHRGWSHAEVASGTVQLIAAREAVAESRQQDAPQRLPMAACDPEGDAAYYEEFSCEPGQDPGRDERVVPFPLRVAYAGALVE